MTRTFRPDLPLCQEASNCWTKSLLCNDAFKQGFRYSECFQKILHSLQVRKIRSLVAVRTTWYTVRRPNCPKHHPSKRRELSIQTFLYVERLQTVPVCIRPDVLAAFLDDIQCSTNLRISFQNTDMGRSLQPSGQCGFPSGRAHP